MIEDIAILTDIVFIALQFVVVFFTYHLLGRKISQPAVLFAAVWFLVLLLHFIFKFTLLKELESLGENTYLIFLTGTICFSLGSVFTYVSYAKLGKSNNDPIVVVPHKINLSLRIICVSIITVALPFYIYAAFKIFLASQAEEFLSGLRYELSYGDADIGPVKYFMPFAYVVYAASLYAYFFERSFVNKCLLIIAFIVLAVYAFFATGRTYFFMTLAVYFGVSFFANPLFSIQKQIAWIVLFISGFMLVGVLYGKGGNTQESVSQNLQSASEYTGVYIVCSLNALEQEIERNTATVKDGDNTLRFFRKLGMQLKLIPERQIPDIKQEFVFVPYPTNVYTYYSPYIRDFGKIYAWFMLAFFGGLHTLLFLKSQDLKSPKSIFYYSFLLFPLLLSFFGDQYLTLLSFWLQLIFFTELFFIINKFLSTRK
ncbi:MAG TPA: O-antigen polymerase [Ferruginibacter sp.]|nr:O-antigen polymerase [Ferruginibacter sp.]HMP19697.1 O-antigen polymerase [Ferruginibacter sp.]